MSIAAGLMIATLAFFQFVFPFFGSQPTETVTCADESFAANCDEDGTLANFFVRLCGREAVEFKALHYESLNPQDTPDTQALRISCGKQKMVEMEYEGRLPLGPQSGEEMRKHLTFGRAAFDMWRDWTYGDVDIAEARRKLLTNE